MILQKKSEEEKVTRAFEATNLQHSPPVKSRCKPAKYYISKEY
jgi:hypothetical protein